MILRAQSGTTYHYSVVDLSNWTQVTSMSSLTGTHSFELPNGTYKVNIHTNNDWALICSPEITFCTDADGDGVCVDEDCDDNDPNLPTTAIGETCNDNDDSTENDVIQEDGCTCTGTPIDNGGGTGETIDCGEVSITYGEGQITMTGQSGTAYHYTIHDLNDGWNVVSSDSYLNGVTTITLTESNYKVKVQVGDGWTVICDPDITLTGTGGGDPNCTDTDGDGVCADEDCDDNDANLPAVEGIACDDGDSETENDVIQADGCTCLGENPSTGGGTTSTSDCNGNTVEYGEGTITLISGGNASFYKVQDANWVAVDHCGWNCGNSFSVSGLAPGDYRVYFQDANYTTICEQLITLEAGGGSECTDADNDGICADEDCDDNDANLPAAEGTACDDGDSETENDVIQADGCTCLGEAIGCIDADGDGLCGEEDCDDSDPNLPAAVGSTCDDNNPLTSNDVYLADGCTCIGIYVASTLYTDSDIDNKIINTNYEVGVIAGGHSVSLTGSAGYNIPITLPPGTKGMVPSISLSYSSGAGNGIVGMGWQVAGMSIIARAPKNLYHDGIVEPVRLNRDDRLTLDGNRLINVTGNYGEEGTVYQTEVENFSRITSFGQVGNTGPESFVVETKTGITYEYGATTDSRFTSQDGTAVIFWRLNKMYDCYGNYVQYKYLNNGAESRIDEILYTGNDTAGQDPYNKIKFAYEERQDKNTMYLGGAIHTFDVSLNSIDNAIANHNSLLNTITITAENNELVKTYQLNYGHNHVQTYLNEIIEKGSDGTQLNSTVFKYGDHSLGTEKRVATNVTASSTSSIIPGDFNGDGLSDFLKVSYNTTEGVDFLESLTPYENNANNTFNEQPSFLPNPSSYQIVRANGIRANTAFISSDYSGDGLDDILMPRLLTSLVNGAAVLQQVDIFSKSGNEWERIHVIPQEDGYELIPSGNNFILPGDFDGDGIMDYLTVLSERNNPDDRKLRRTSPGAGIINIENSIGTTTLAGGVLLAEADELSVIDFNGDGKDDILVQYLGQVLIFNHFKEQDGSEGFVLINFENRIWEEYYFGDFNGDGKTDFLGQKSDDTWEIGYSNGEDFVFAPFSFNTNPEIGIIDNPIVIGDFDGNGKSDIVFMKIGRYDRFLDNLSLIIETYYSNGMEFYKDCELQYLDYPRRIKKLINGDYNGDGIIDLLLQYELDNGSIEILPFNAFKKTNLLEKVANGFKTVTEFEYTPLTDASTYTKSELGQYPFIKIQAPLYVTKSVTVPDGIGGTNTVAYQYEDATVHMRGKGLLGFEKVITNDFTNGTKTTVEQTFNTTYAVGVLQNSTIQRITNNTFLTSSSPTYTFIDRGNGRYWFRSESSIEIDHIQEVTSTSSYTYDDYGNVNSETLSIGGIETITKTSTDFGTYCSPVPNRPKFTTITSQRLDKPMHEKKIMKVYDESSGVITQEVEYFQTDKAVTTDYSDFDDFGNSETVSISALGLETRTTTIDYDDKGRFALTTTNALNQSESATFDPKWGKPLTSTSIDELVTVYKYDGYGRLTETNTPLGFTIKNYWKWDVQSENGTSTTSADNSIYYTETITPGKPNTKVWFDQFNRERQSSFQGFEFEWINSVKTYDERGKIKTETSPFYNGDTPIITTYNYFEDTPNPKFANYLQNIVSSLGTTHYNYSSSGGNMTTVVTNPAQQATTQMIDATGKVVESTDNDGIKITMEYDSYGNEINTKQGDKVLVNMTYDEYGRQETLVEPNSGTTTYRYNAFGELEYQKDARGNESTYFYDVLGRPDYEIIPEGTIDYEYETETNGRGSLKKITNYNGVEKEYFFNALGQTTGMIDRIDGEMFTTVYGYNSTGDNTIITYPSGLSIERSYHPNGYLEGVSSGNTIIFLPEAQNAYNQYTEYILGNGKSTKRTYDQYGLPDLFEAGVNGEIQQLDFSFNVQNGNLDFRSDLRIGKRDDFQYDAINRLKEITTGTNSLLTHYETNGNISFKSDVGMYNSYIENKINSIKLNTAGEVNMPIHQQEIPVYTSFQQPDNIIEGFHKINYTYGTDLNRIKSVLSYKNEVNTIRYYLGNYEKNITDGNVQEIHYIGVDGLNAIVVVENGSHDFYYTYTDHLGSILTVTDGTGSIIAEQNFDAWGRNRNAQDWTYDNIASVPDWLYRGYTGHEHLPEFGLINMNGRLYDPLVGRMLSADNLVPDPMSLQGYNRYSYVMNNPLKYTDPDGENPVLIGAAIGFLSNGISNAANGQNFFSGGAEAAIWGGISGGISAGIGAGAQALAKAGWGPGGVAAFQFGAHGLTGGAISAGQGGNFWHGASAGGISSLVSSGIGSISGDKNFLAIGGAIAGGLGSRIAGGNFIDGFGQGLITSALNHASDQLEYNLTKAKFKKALQNAGKCNPCTHQEIGRYFEALVGAHLIMDGFQVVPGLPISMFGLGETIPDWYIGLETTKGGFNPFGGMIEVKAKKSGSSLGLFSQNGQIFKQLLFHSVSGLTLGGYGTYTIVTTHGVKVSSKIKAFATGLNIRTNHMSAVYKGRLSIHTIGFRNQKF